jgi:hypothetical protein
VGWFERAKKASAGQRVTRADQQRALDTAAELAALNGERQRLMRDGLDGVATITAIRHDVATTPLGSWHELELDVQLPDHDAYRATRRVCLQLSTAPHLSVGAQVPVRVDPQDFAKVLVLARL